jgi:hypothetical protein
MLAHFCIDVREEIATAGGFPFEVGTEVIAVDGGEHEAGLALKPFGERFLHLLRCREVDIAVGDIDGRQHLSARFDGGELVCG